MVSFIDAIGTGLFLAGSALFFTQALGLSAKQVGLGLSLSGIAGLIGMVPVGRLADRIGGKRALIALHIWRGSCFAAYPFVDGPKMFFVVAFLIGIAEWSIGPIVQSVIGTVEQGASRVRTMAALTAVRNVGFTIGAVLATVALTSADTRIYSGLVIADAATFFLAAGLLARLPIPMITRSGGRGGDKPRRPVRQVRYLLLTALNGVLYLHTILLTVGLPLWIATQTSAPRAIVGVVVVVNTVIAIVLQVPLSRGTNDTRDAARRQQWAGWCLAACCLLAALTADAGAVAASVLVIIAIVALTLGEIWQSIGAWGISFALAPEDQRTYYLSVYNLGLTGATVLGPAMVTYAVVQNGAIGWAGLAAVFAVAGSAVVLVARGAGAPPIRTEPTETEQVTTEQVTTDSGPAGTGSAQAGAGAGQAEPVKVETAAG